jgi:hypothetical protein
MPRDCFGPSGLAMTGKSHGMASGPSGLAMTGKSHGMASGPSGLAIKLIVAVFGPRRNFLEIRIFFVVLTGDTADPERVIALRGR